MLNWLVIGVGDGYPPSPTRSGCQLSASAGLPASNPSDRLEAAPFIKPPALAGSVRRALENNFCADLDVARSGHGSVPMSEVGARYIIIDRESEAAVTVYGEGMPVPEVESFDPDFDADFFGHSRGFADTEVLVVVAKRTVVGNARPLAEVEVKVADRLKGSPVKQRSQPGIEASKLGKRAGARQDAGNAPRRELNGYIAEPRAEEKRRAGLVAENGARLPASHHVVEDPGPAQEPL